MGKRTALLAVLAVLGGTVAVETLDGSAAPAARQPSARLLRFGDCSDLVGYMKQHADPHVTASGFLGRVGVEAVGPLPPPPVARPVPGAPVASGTATVIEQTTAAGPMPAPTEDDHSRTNVQEAGVDEPDLVKTDGTTVFAVAQGKLYSVDVGARRPHTVNAVRLGDHQNHELLLHGQRLLVFSHDDAEGVLSAAPRPIDTSPPPPVSAISPTAPAPPTTTLTEIDVSKPGWMKVVRRLTFQGRYVSARLVKGTARVVFTSSVPNELHFFRPRHFAYPDEALARNRAVIAESKAANWLPSYEIRNVRSKARTQRSVQCRHVARPPEFSGFGMLTVLTIDLDKGIEPIEADAVLGDGDLVYASDASLYVATQRWTDPVVGDRRSTLPPTIATALHKFDISRPSSTAYRASGAVPGYLLNQWALSEHKGVLRAASTRFPSWWTGVGGESSVTTFKQRAGRLVEIGRVGALGRGERIFGVRFMGDVGYVVTFRQTDPLYTLDLSDPARPKLRGELKIPGYSAYLHPAGNDLLLGLGQDASADGSTFGTQLSLFDVSNLEKPVRLSHRTIDGGSSEAETDHHAFLYWASTRLAVVPLETTWSGRPFQGVVGFRVNRRGIEEVGRVTHGRGRLVSWRSWSSSEPIRRTLVVRDSLLTVSAAGVRASDLATFADRGFARFSAGEVR